jgi:hypothetical protein
MSAAWKVCSAVSTAHGPAMSTKVDGPRCTVAASPTVTTEASGWFSRLTSL